MKIAIAQLNPTIGSIKANAEKIKKCILRARGDNVELIVFPELALTGCPPRDLLLNDGFLTLAEKTLREEILPLTEGITVLLGTPWRDEKQERPEGGYEEQSKQWKKVSRLSAPSHLYNAALALKSGKIISKHYKTFLQNHDVFDESRYFTAAAGKDVFTVGGLKITVIIGEEVWNCLDPSEHELYTDETSNEFCTHENPTGGAEAELLINISASPYHLGKSQKRREMLVALAERYKAPLIYVNQVGGNDELIFDGSSAFCDGLGDKLSAKPTQGCGSELRDEAEEGPGSCYMPGPEPGFWFLPKGKDQSGSDSESGEWTGYFQAPPFQETLIYCDLENLKFTCFDAVDITPEAAAMPLIRAIDYEQTEDVNWVYAGLQLGLADYLRKTGFDKVLIGLSGGIDSAVVAALAVSVLGPESVLGVMLPSRYSTDHSITDSELLAENLGIRTLLIPIEDHFKQFVENLNAERKPILDLAEENLQARIRGNILMFISNRDNRMLLTTSNKSELAVGYCTLYGDMCGGLAALADLPKLMVYRLAEYINDQAGKDLIPREIIDKPPSAELRPDQMDQDSLPPYEVLDKLLYYYIEENMSIDEIAALGFERELVASIAAKVDRSEYKRSQAAPALRITSKAFGSGRRMPIVRGYFK